MSAVSSQNYYELLGISKTATDSEIREAYKKMAFKSHPDKARQNNLTIEKATATFKLVNEAYETLSNPLKRRMYDTKGSHIFAGASAPSRGASSHSTPPRSDFFNEGFDFHSFNFRGFAHEYQREDETICPNKREKEATNLIDGDDSDLLDQYLKTKNFENSFLKTMLYDACKRGKLNIVKYFIEIRKLNPNLKVQDGLSFTGPIFKAAAESGNLELVKYLLENHHVDIESQGLSPGTRSSALSRAALKGHLEVVKYLVSKGANLNPDIGYSNILLCAIASKNLPVVMFLAEAGSKFDDFNLGYAFEHGVLDIVQYLLQKRPGIQTHQYTESPACKAVRSGNVTLVKYLEEKENLDIYEKHRDWDDSIALLLIAGAESGSIEMMKYLLEEKGLGEKVSANVKYAEAALSEAVRNRTCCPTEDQVQERLKFVQFLMEEKQITLPKDKLEYLIADRAQFAGIEMNSYLQSYLSDSDHIKNMWFFINCRTRLLNMWFLNPHS